MAKDLTIDQIVDKQIKRAQGAVGDYREGVRKTKKRPMEEAVKKLGKMRTNFIEAMDDGRVQEGFESVSDAEWKEMTATKGGDNYANGVAKSRPKLVEFQTQMKPHRDRVSQTVQEMPNDTYEQRKARANAAMDGMHEFRFKRRRRGA